MLPFGLPPEIFRMRTVKIRRSWLFWLNQSGSVQHRAVSTTKPFTPFRIFRSRNEISGAVYVQTAVSPAQSSKMAARAARNRFGCDGEVVIVNILPSGTLCALQPLSVAAGTTERRRRIPMLRLQSSGQGQEVGLRTGEPSPTQKRIVQATPD